MHVVTGADGMETGTVQLGVIGRNGSDWHPDWYAIEKTPEMHAADDRAKLIARLSSRAGRVDEVRWELVERLKTEIAAGTYSVRAEEVAAGILRSLSEAV